MQTRYIFETNTISSEDNKTLNVNDIIETQNHFRCIDYVIEHSLEPLTETIIKDLHYILKTGSFHSKLNWFKVGDYKLIPNTVGGEQTSSPENVRSDILNLLGQYEMKKNISFEDIVEFHYHFEIIHPFQDGNGRVGRLIAFKECLRHGIVPFTIDDSIYRDGVISANPKEHLWDFSEPNKVYLAIDEYIAYSFVETSMDEKDIEDEILILQIDTNHPLFNKDKLYADQNISYSVTEEIYSLEYRDDLSIKTVYELYEL